MRSAFFGTPDSAVPVLEALVRISEVTIVGTQPDRPRGRSKVPKPSPVRTAAERHGIAVAMPKDRTELGAMAALFDLDVAVVAAFGMIIPADVLDIPGAGFLNVHYSLLPAWRGAAPVERAIEAGDQSTGITLMAMDQGLDTGPILTSWETAIGSDETGGELTTRLAVAAGEIVARDLAAIVAGDINTTPQDSEAASYAPMLSPADSRLDFNQTADDLIRRIRAFNPRPGARTTWRGELFKIHRAHRTSARLEPGEIVLADGVALVGTQSEAIGLLEVQPAGSKPMDAGAWARGVRGDLGRFE